MVGTLERAHMALDGLFPCIGEGSFRSAYRDGNVVYKVHLPVDEEDVYDGWDPNADEFIRWSDIIGRNLPAFIRVPNASLYHVNGESVIAMDYIEGKALGECWCTEGEEHLGCIDFDTAATITNETGIMDLAYGNIIEANGIYWLIDLQH